MVFAFLLSFSFVLTIGRSPSLLVTYPVVGLPSRRSGRINLCIFGMTCLVISVVIDETSLLRMIGIRHSVLLTYIFVTFVTLRLLNVVSTESVRVDWTLPLHPLSVRVTIRRPCNSFVLPNLVLCLAILLVACLASVVISTSSAAAPLTFTLLALTSRQFPLPYLWIRLTFIDNVRNVLLLATVGLRRKLCAFRTIP